MLGSASATPVRGIAASSDVAALDHLGGFIDTYNMDRGDRFDPHEHPYHQFIWSPDGRLAVETDRQTWITSPAIAIWIPGDVRHDVVALRTSTMRSVYLDGSWPSATGTPTAVLLDDLLRVVLEVLASRPTSTARRARLEAVLHDCLVNWVELEHPLPMPTDVRCREIANELMINPGDDREFAAWGRQVGASVRTITRVFATETGLSFDSWRRLARLHVARSMVRSGVSIDQTARTVGYRSSSSLAAAYRAQFGHRPTDAINVAAPGT